jgi:hypothetical protein
MMCFDMCDARATNRTDAQYVGDVQRVTFQVHAYKFRESNRCISATCMACDWGNDLQVISFD